MQDSVSTKNLGYRDFKWSTGNMVLGWVVDMVNLTVVLTPHMMDHLNTTLKEIPHHKFRIHVHQWHRVLKDLHSMALYIPGGAVIFIYMKCALYHIQVRWVIITEVFNSTLDNFLWIPEYF